MKIEDEIHAINGKLGDLMLAIAVLQEKRISDKEDSVSLSKQVANLAISVNRLNLTLAKSEGRSEGISLTVKIVRGLTGALIFVTIVGTVTLLWDINDRLTKLEAGAK